MPLPGPIRIPFLRLGRTQECFAPGRNGEAVSVKLICDNAQERSRAETFLSKEPETLSWLRRHTRPGETMWDIGACIGQYSIFAARLGLNVYAFEPHLANAAKLLRNVGENGLCGSVHIAPICISDHEAFGNFFASSFEPGSSIHAFRDDGAAGTIAIAFPGQTVLAQYSHGVFCTTVDRLIYGFYRWNCRAPEHIKIDTDGNEWAVLRGMKRFLEAATLRSLLVEMHDDDLDRVRDFMRQYGFQEDTDYPDTSREREKRRAIEEGGRWAGHGNVVFVRYR